MHRSGGLELLFGKQKEYSVDVPANGQLTVGQLLPWTRDQLLKDRPELFMKGDTVRPGILVLVNDCDWELRCAAAAETDWTHWSANAHNTVTAFRRAPIMVPEASFSAAREAV
eukprot:GHRR01027373.1.p1 GENE.GHRR01027373.1~~GHRR01027373.1.p1  ORF type:complete len:113 (+),score=21.30 GHRR01027373.1:83-421(+)